MKKNEIKIIIAGVAGVGKSTLLQIIGEALAAKGLAFEVSTHEGWNPLMDDEGQMVRLGSVKGKGPKIVLEERPVRHAIMSQNYEIVGLTDKES